MNESGKPLSSGEQITQFVAGSATGFKLRGTSISERVGSVDSVHRYYDEIGRVSLLSREEEVMLAKRIEAGKAAEEQMVAAQEVFDGNGVLGAELKRPTASHLRKLSKLIQEGEMAREALTQANLRLVVSIARRYRAPGLSQLDLIQEGNLGLMRAVGRFDHTKGFKFSTYATWWIRQAISHAIAEQSRTIRIPVHMVDTINKVHRVRMQMVQILKREPTTEELATEVGLNTSRVNEILIAGLDTLSLDSPVNSEDDTGLGDLIEDTDAVEPGKRTVMNLRNEAVLSVLDGLTERERRILELRFGFINGRTYTLEEVGQEVGVTRERVRQIETKVLSKLRQRERSTNLKDYLDT